MIIYVCMYIYICERRGGDERETWDLSQGIMTQQMAFDNYYDYQYYYYY